MRIFGNYVRNDPDREEHAQTIVHQDVVIIRNTNVKSPNLTLNVHNDVGRGELYAVAVCGVVLQLGVLAYSGVITYYPALKFLKDGAPVSDYAFPCTAVGTLFLVAGMAICSHVIESSTSEKRYRPHARQARVVWLQKSGTVNDQAFESFAIFPPDAQSLVTTSQRADSEGPAPHYGIKAIAGTFVSLCGFVTQFIGLRGMHWSATIAQLIATVIMAALRSWVRRDLAKNPQCEPLQQKHHELDWLAMTLGDPTKAPWESSSKDDSGENHYWGIAAVQEPAEVKELEPRGQNAGTNTDGSESMAHRVMTARRDLGELAGWRGPASAEAIALARAIEITMDALFSESTKDDSSEDEAFFFTAEDESSESEEDESTESEEESFTWAVAARTSFGQPGPESDPELIAFRVDRQKSGNWKAYADEIEAALSLWLYSVHEREKNLEGRSSTGNQVTGKNEGPDKPPRSRDDAWLRIAGTTEKPYLCLLGSHTGALLQDLQWWMPDGAARVIQLHDTDSEHHEGEVEAHRVIGFADNAMANPDKVGICQYKKKAPGPSCKDTPLAVESYAPLATVFARHMFSAFMWAAAKKMKAPISGRSAIRHIEADESRR